MTLNDALEVLANDYPVWMVLEMLEVKCSNATGSMMHGRFALYQQLCSHAKRTKAGTDIPDMTVAERGVW